MSDHADNPHHSKRWAILAVLGIAQLMVVLDSTVVNIALPSAQADLGFSDANRQWVITAYALAFGSTQRLANGNYHFLLGILLPQETANKDCGLGLHEHRK